MTKVNMNFIGVYSMSLLSVELQNGTVLSVLILKGFLKLSRIHECTNAH